MKIKSDFVTNSSSSSFIVFWPYEVKTRNDVEKYIKRLDFIDIIAQDTLEGGGIIIEPTKQVLQRLISEIDSGLVEEINNYYECDQTFTDRHAITNKDLWNIGIWQHQSYMENLAINQKNIMIFAARLIEDHEGRYAYIYTYADEDGGIFSKLEHENDWGNLPYIRINKH